MTDFANRLWRARLRHALRLPRPIHGGADWPVVDVSAFSPDDTVLPSFAKTVTAPGGTHTKGAWTELIAACPLDADGILFELSGSSNITYLYDIGIGASGQEKVLVPNIWYAPSNTSSNNSKGGIFIPCSIRKGVRISLRYQASSTGGAHQAKLQVFAGGFANLLPVSSWRDYGTDLANSRGTAIAAGNSAFGSWVQFAALTSEEISWVLVSANLQTGSLLANVIEIGVGPSGQERTLIPGMFWTNENGNQILLTFPCKIPAKSRLSARAAVSGAGQTAFVSLLGG